MCDEQSFSARRGNETFAEDQRGQPRLKLAYIGFFLAHNFAMITWNAPPN